MSRILHSHRACRTLFHFYLQLTRPRTLQQHDSLRRFALSTLSPDIHALQRFFFFPSPARVKVALSGKAIASCSALPRVDALVYMLYTHARAVVRPAVISRRVVVVVVTTEREWEKRIFFFLDTEIALCVSKNWKTRYIYPRHVPVCAQINISVFSATFERVA